MEIVEQLNLQTQKVSFFEKKESWIESLFSLKSEASSNTSTLTPVSFKNTTNKLRRRGGSYIGNHQPKDKETKQKNTKNNLSNPTTPRTSIKTLLIVKQQSSPDAQSQIFQQNKDQPQSPQKHFIRHKSQFLKNLTSSQQDQDQDQNHQNFLEHFDKSFDSSSAHTRYSSLYSSLSVTATPRPSFKRRSNSICSPSIIFQKFEESEDNSNEKKSNIPDQQKESTDKYVENKELLTPSPKENQQNSCESLQILVPNSPSSNPSNSPQRLSRSPSPFQVPFRTLSSRSSSPFKIPLVKTPHSPRSPQTPSSPRTQNTLVSSPSSPSPPLLQSRASLFRPMFQEPPPPPPLPPLPPPSSQILSSWSGLLSAIQQKSVARTISLDEINRIEKKMKELQATIHYYKQQLNTLSNQISNNKLNNNSNSNSSGSGTGSFGQALGYSSSGDDPKMDDFINTQSNHHHHHHHLLQQPQQTQQEVHPLELKAIKINFKLFESQNQLQELTLILELKRQELKEKIKNPQMINLNKNEINNTNNTNHTNNINNTNNVNFNNNINTNTNTNNTNHGNTSISTSTNNLNANINDVNTTTKLSKSWSNVNQINNNNNNNNNNNKSNHMVVFGGINRLSISSGQLTQQQHQQQQQQIHHQNQNQNQNQNHHLTQHQQESSPSLMVNTNTNTNMNINIRGIGLEKLLCQYVSAEVAGLKKDTLPAEDDLLNEIGEYLVNYEDIKVISYMGHGAYGTVYSAVYKGIKVAMKIIRNRTDKKGNMVCFQSFLREVTCLKKAKEISQVVKFVGACFKPSFCILTEFCEGGSLSDLVYKDKQTLSLVNCVQIARTIAEGISQLHSKNIVHRDIALRNILLPTRNSTKPLICDFGIAVVKGKGVVPMSPTGSRRHQAPEALNWDRDSGLFQGSKKVDTYMFGTVLYELYFGTDPFEGIENHEVVKRKRSGLIPTIPDDHTPFSSISSPSSSSPFSSCMVKTCPKSLRKLILSCWSYNPKKRPKFREIITRLNSIEYKYERIQMKKEKPKERNKRKEKYP